MHLYMYFTQATAEPHLVAMAIHPVTNQLLLLLSSGDVQCVRVGGGEGGGNGRKVMMGGGRVRVRHLVQLSDFCHRYRTPGTLIPTGPAPDSGIQLFAIQTYYGLFVKGEIRWTS